MDPAQLARIFGALVETEPRPRLRLQQAAAALKSTRLETRLGWLSSVLSGDDGTVIDDGTTIDNGMVIEDPAIVADPTGVTIDGLAGAFGIGSLAVQVRIGSDDRVELRLGLAKGRTVALGSDVSWTALSATLSLDDAATAPTASLAGRLRVGTASVDVSLLGFVAGPPSVWTLATTSPLGPLSMLLAPLVGSLAEPIGNVLPLVLTALDPVASLHLVTSGPDPRLAISWPLRTRLDVSPGQISIDVTTLTAMLRAPLDATEAWAPAIELDGTLLALGTTTPGTIRVTQHPRGLALRSTISANTATTHSVGQLLEAFGQSKLDELLDQLPTTLRARLGASALTELAVTIGPGPGDVGIAGTGNVLGFSGEAHVDIVAGLVGPTVSFALRLDNPPASLGDLLQQDLGIAVDAPLRAHLPAVRLALRELAYHGSSSVFEVGGAVAQDGWELDLRLGLLPGGFNLHMGDLYHSGRRAPTLVQLFDAVVPGAPFDAALWNEIAQLAPPALARLISTATVHDAAVSWFPATSQSASELRAELVVSLQGDAGPLVSTLAISHSGSWDGYPARWSVRAATPFLRLDLVEMLDTFGLPTDGLGIDRGQIEAELLALAINESGVEVEVEVDVDEHAARLMASLQRVAGGWQWDLSLSVAGFVFALHAVTQPELILTGRLDASNAPVRLAQLTVALGLGELPGFLDFALETIELRSVPSRSGLGVTAAVRIGTHSATVGLATAALAGPPAGRRWLIAAEAPSLSFGLGDVPVVGRVMPNPQAFALDIRDLVLRYSPTALSAGDLTVLDALTEQPQPAAAGVGQAGGLSLRGKVEVAGRTVPLAAGELPIRTGVVAATPATPAAPAGPVPPPTITWQTVNKAIGPVHVAAVGVGFADGHLQVGVTGSLELGPLELSLIGLRVGVPLAALTRPAALDQTTIELDGMGVQLDTGAVTVGGALVRHADRMDGAALVSAQGLSVNVMASLGYTEHGDPALFMYGVLRKAIGGPSFFFVTGLAAGFGYNRDLVLPEVQHVADFILVKSAIGLGPTPTSVREMMALLEEPDAVRAFPPRDGSMFFAVGVKFTSFRIVDSFLIVTVAFGHGGEIGLLGLSTLDLPPAIAGAASPPPLAHVRLALRATYAVATGRLEVLGLLVGSYILSERCTLQGGFGVFAQLKQIPGGAPEGDFAITVGGYHPHFKPESWYPCVPRLALSWQVDPHLLVKGAAYFAITAKAAMAGGSLDATWNEERLSARFRVAADFLVQWQPYHYEASMQVGIEGRADLWLFSINISVNAALEVYGPPFGGRAIVDLGVCSATVEFGAGHPPKLPLPVGDFASSFLPPAAAVCGASLLEGGLGHDERSGIWRVSPDRLVVEIHSGVPITAAHAGVDALTSLRAGLPPSSSLAFDREARSVWHAVPLAPCATNASAPLAFSVTRRHQGADIDATHAFAVQPVYKGAPAALWDHKGADAETPTVRTVGGFTLATGPARVAPATARLPLEQLESELLNATTDGLRLVADLPALRSRKVSDRRDVVLAGLGLDAGQLPRTAAPPHALRLATLAVGDP